jgi:FMN reductase
VARTEDGGFDVAEVLQERLTSAMEELIEETRYRIERV